MFFYYFWALFWSIVETIENINNIIINKMKAIALQFGKAMSAALFVLLLVVVGSKNALAQTLVATLQHDGEITCFYGNSALSEAYNAAENDDIITLSRGNFSLSSITKAITLRGAGILTDTILGSYATTITSAITAEIDNNSASLTIEGIRFTNSFKYISLSNPRFIKCYFGTFNSNDANSTMSNAQFVNCRINEINNAGTDATVINSILWSCKCDFSMAYNSYINIGSSNYPTINAFNCIVKGGWYDNMWNVYMYQLNQNSLAINCIGIKGSLNNAIKQNCWLFDDYSSVFETFTGSNYDVYTEQLILKEEIANTCLGDDGKEVGIYGGNVPYNNRPNYMVIKRCNVANQSTIDGKLSVEIEVVTEEE